MKIAIFGTSLLYPSNKEYTISGHAQIPLMTATLLSESSQNVEIITTDAPNGYAPPSFVPNSVNVKTVPNIFSELRGGEPQRLKYPKFVTAIRRYIADNDYDIVHFFGTEKIGLLAHFITATTKIPETHMTYINYRGGTVITDAIRRYSNCLNCTHFLTETTHNRFQECVSGDVSTNVTRPGILRDFDVNHSPFGSRKYVLFWRNAHPKNGADLCKSVFEELSGLYPKTDFVFAVRHNDIYEPKIEEACSSNTNLHILRHPYENNTTIEGLLTGATAVVLPFRELSINPQFAILETLASGSALITTPIESNKELILDGINGVLTPPKEKAIKKELIALLENPEKRKSMEEMAETSIKKNWNWDRYKDSLQEVYSKW